MLLQRFRPATAANRYSSLKQFFRWLEEEGEIEASPWPAWALPTPDVTTVDTEEHIEELLPILDDS